jgi:hypothetical protein
MISIVQRAKFSLMYSRAKVVVHDHDHDRDYVEEDLQESGPIQPAIIEVHGLRLHSDTPKTAAEAEKINRALTRLTEALPPISP